MAKKANQTEDQKKLISLLEERVEQNKSQLSNAQNYINLAYYLGKQWISWDATNKRVYEPSPDGKTRFVANRIQKIVRTELAKVMKNKPIMDCVPASKEEDDIRASKIGDQIIDYLEYTHKLHNKVDKKVVMWGLTTEIGYVHPYWDTTKGEKIIHPETGETVMTGSENIDVLSAFDVILDPEAKSWGELKWFIKPKVKDVSYIEERYKVKVAPEEGIEINDGIARQLDSLYSKYGQTNERKSKTSATIYECWEMPCKDYPQGRRWAIAGGQFLYVVNDIGFGPKDDTERELPLFPFIHIEVPGRIQGQAIVESLIPVQREYNRSRSQIIDNKDLMANPAWVYQDGAIDDPDDISNFAGGHVVYNQGFTKPERDQPPQMGNDVYKNLEQLAEEFYFISGQQEVSHGGTPPGVTSGVAISYLQEQDNSVIAPTIDNFIVCKQGYMSYLLKMIKYKYDYPRTLRIVGKSNEVNMLEFIGSDLTSTDVRIQEGSMYQDTKAGKQNWVMNLVNAGVLNAQMDRDLILRMLELGMIDEMYDESQIDIDQARKEQMKWEDKDFDNTIVRDFYNHMVHIREHDRFRKGDIYDDMSADEQAEVDAHILKHQVFMQQSLLSQMTPPMIPGMEGGNPNDGTVSEVPNGTEGQASTNTKSPQ